MIVVPEIPDASSPLSIKSCNLTVVFGIVLFTEGRFSGGSHGFIIGHITPEAYVGGEIAYVRNNDIIEIDAENYTINTINISKEDLKNRDDYQKARTNFKYNREKGYLNKYRHLVTPASLGCYIN